jgi:hypothetical protein
MAFQISAPAARRFFSPPRLTNWILFLPADPPSRRHGKRRHGAERLSEAPDPSPPPAPPPPSDVSPAGASGSGRVHTNPFSPFAVTRMSRRSAGERFSPRLVGLWREGRTDGRKKKAAQPASPGPFLRFRQRAYLLLHHHIFFFWNNSCARILALTK